MTWGSVSEFLAMGGYSLYVWGSFGVAAALIVAELVSLGLRRRAALERIDGGRQ
jgi:heme exporter protein D